MANFSIKADLLKVKGAFVTNLKGKTSTKRCLVIPIDESGMYLGEKGCYLNLTAFEMREERYGDTHVLKQEERRMGLKSKSKSTAGPTSRSGSGTDSAFRGGRFC